MSCLSSNSSLALAADAQPFERMAQLGFPTLVARQCISDLRSSPIDPELNLEIQAARKREVAASFTKKQGIEGRASELEENSQGGSQRVTVQGKLTRAIRLLLGEKGLFAQFVPARIIRH